MMKTDQREGTPETPSPEQHFVMLSLRALLTFLLPSVTMSGTGIGGHLLRLGAGFSLFHRMMIWGDTTTRLISFGFFFVQLAKSNLHIFCRFLFYLRAVLGLGHHLQQLHDGLRLRDQRGDGVDDSRELLAWTDP